MDGKTLLYELREALNEDSAGEFLETSLSYTYLNEAATEFVRRTQCLSATTDITTVADQAEYDLPFDFFNLNLMDGRNDLYVKFTYGSSTAYIAEGTKREVFRADNSSSVRVPSKFYIDDKQSLDSRVIVSASATSAASLGESVLTVASASFSSIEAGDSIHNDTDGSSGYVLEKTSSTGLITALFNGTNNYWTVGDLCVVQPSGRMQIVMDPAPSTSGDTITVPYVVKPNPVYADYRSWRIPDFAKKDIIDYAAFRYKYRDREPAFAGQFYKTWDMQAKNSGFQINKAQHRSPLRVNLKARK